MMPTAAIDGQFVCAGCGSEAISCDDELLLTKVTLWPVVIVTCAGFTAPSAPIVIAAPLGPGPEPELTTGPEPDGPDGLLLPSPHAGSAAAIATTDAYLPQCAEVIVCPLDPLKRTFAKC